MLAGKGVIRDGDAEHVKEWLVQVRILIPPHLLTNFEIQNYYQSEPKSTGVYSRCNLRNIKDGVYIVNRDSINQEELIG